MNDMSGVIVPKSDQINADDLITGPRTITIEDVAIRGGQEQPVSIRFAGSDKVFRPCKSMSRVLVAAWGPDASKYKGRSITLYRDPKVKWGGMEVGGIRISHLSHIDQKMRMALTATKGRRDECIILPIADAPGAPQRHATPVADKRAAAEQMLATNLQRVAVAQDAARLDAIAGQKPVAALATAFPDLHAQLIAAIDERRAAIAPTHDPETGELALEGPADADRGEAVTLADAERALAEAQKTGDAAQVSAIVQSYAGQLGEEDHDALATAASDVIAAMQGAK